MAHVLALSCDPEQTPLIDLNAFSNWIWTNSWILNPTESGQTLEFLSIHGGRFQSIFLQGNQDPERSSSLDELRGGSRSSRPGALHTWLFSTHQLVGLCISHSMLCPQVLLVRAPDPTTSLSLFSPPAASWEFCSSAWLQRPFMGQTPNVAMYELPPRN